jgi:hypothetical protein
MQTEQHGFGLEDIAYGFRHDPMDRAHSDETLEGAVVRAQVLRTPGEGDHARIAAAVAELLAGQNADGGFGGDGDATTATLLKLLDLGCDLGARGGRTAGGALVRMVDAGVTARAAPGGATTLPMSADDARALCGLGATTPALHQTLRWYADNVDVWMEDGCPWGQAATIATLAAGRAVTDVEDGLREALTRVVDDVNGAGCIGQRDPWAYVEVAAATDHPLAGVILRKQLTLLLRAQDADGGWTMPEWWPTRQSSKVVFRALSRHGLLNRLRRRPPLPPGWTIRRSIPAPEGELWGLAWDGSAWWTCDEAAKTAIHFDAEGAVLGRVPLPPGAGRGLGCWDGAPTLAQGSPWEGDPKRVVRLDRETGECLAEWPLVGLSHAGGVAGIDGDLWVSDSFHGRLHCFDAAGNVVRADVGLAGPLPVGLAPEGDTLWHDDLWAPFFIRSSLADGGQFVDCIEKPFREPFAPKPYGGVTRGIGHNDEGLWVIDRSEGRIILLESASEAAAGALEESAADSVRHAAQFSGRPRKRTDSPS